MKKKIIKYLISNLQITKDKYIINSDGSIIIKNLIVDVEKVKHTQPQNTTDDKKKPDKKKSDKDKGKNKSKHMTEKRVRTIVKEEIDTTIRRNNAYLLSEMDKKIDDNNTYLLRAMRNIVKEEVRDIVKEEVANAVAPINEKLDKVIKLNNLKTK